MAVASGQRQHLRCQVFGQAVRQRRAVGVQHLADPGELRRGGSGGCGLVARYQHMDFWGASQGGGEGVARRAFERGVVVFSNEECGHDGLVQS